jgi:two-component system, LytTR family, sensor kinase
MLVSATWIIPAILGAVDTLAQQRVWGGPPVPLRAVLFTSGDWLLYALFTPVVFVLSRRWPLARPHLARNAAIHVAISLLFCAAWAGAGTLLKLAVDPHSFDGGVLKFFVSWVFTTLPFGVAVYLAVVGIEHALRYFGEARERDVQLARLSGQLTSARLSALQARLNPHFLFNSLNTIAVLVRGGDNGRATRVIEHLSEVLRQTLSRSRDAEVSLDDELELVRQYLAVEAARFSDRLHVEIEVQESLLSAAVPSFALQHLVENAIRHGIARRTDAGRIVVSARRVNGTIEVTVRDDGAGFEPGADRADGHGLEHTRERLRTLYGDRASLVVERVGQGTIARLTLPYREVAFTASPDAEH